MRQPSSRWLPVVLLLSVAINVGLLSTFAYFSLVERRLPYPVDQIIPVHSENASLTNLQCLSSYAKMSFAELIQELKDSEILEEGYSKRDLALSMLTTFYHFNIEAALGDHLEKRAITIYHPVNHREYTVHLFPGLTEVHYQAVFQYLDSEKWPFTTQGLFHLVQKMGSSPTASLQEAFSMTAEFQEVVKLFTKSGMQIESSFLIQMIAQGEFDTLKTFCAEQRVLQDLTLNRRQHLLQVYLNAGSSMAARILVEAEQEFAAKKLSDQEVLKIFELYPVRSPFMTSFAKQLLKSPRSGIVWKRALEVLGARSLLKKEVSQGTGS